MTTPIKPINLFEYETLAKQHLSQMALDYYASGSWDEITLRDNRAAFERYKLCPRMLVDVSQRDLSTKILGQTLPLPILIAPMAFQCLAHPEGEIATAKAAAKLGSTMILSTLATKSIEEVASASQNPNYQLPITNYQLWFQLYVHRDRGLTKALVERAYKAGYQALCLTVDAPVLGKRERDTRNQFVLPPGMELANLTTVSDLEITYKPGESGLFAYFLEQLNPGLTWKDLEWVQSLSPLPLVVKGILRGDDAVRAVECGAKAIIVSNHGGRQLDSAIASIDALSQIVAAVGDKADILVDGGIRRGTDILKALALGAKAVLLGRPILWGLAVGGEAGVQHVIELLRAELDLAMALSGCAKLQDIDSSLVIRLSIN
ncbi:MAG TPA: alpha-hydroxy-acid oxidizing enzyme [Cyanobacteria bacterium UBA11369]|nr:alpha-hydroxy-acid oxidizing enzyme [Cyanobacteria bacterium UBA11371]HBE31489.1 alpha-hydroxy-acid oxidizing enzyme [Cyanobacteria bacterium UBA11368]HBE52377.1 alpha-hydroxy-acid oxidizing enzyme [Cyanobacteria bacterium UBA11369]